MTIPGFKFDQKPANTRSRHMVAIIDGKEFTEGQATVLKLLADAYNVKEIAAMMGVSTFTIEVYKRKVFAKVGSTRPANAVKFAIKHGLSTL